MFHNSNCILSDCIVDKNNPRSFDLYECEQCDVVPLMDDFCLGLVWIVLLGLFAHRAALILAHLTGHPTAVPEFWLPFGDIELRKTVDGENVLKIEWNKSKVKEGSEEDDEEKSVASECSKTEEVNKFDSLKCKRGGTRWSHPSLPPKCDYDLAETVLGTDLPGGNYGT